MEPRTFDARERMTIGALAGAAGVPTSTIRYYERRGLLGRARRGPSGYRQYGPADLRRLRFIRAAQQMGLTLDDADVLLRYERDSSVPCGDVRVLLARRLERVRAELAALRRARSALEKARKLCDSSPRDRCLVLDALRDSSVDTSNEGG